MLGGDKTIDEESRERYDDAIETFYERALGLVPELVARIPDQRLQESVYDHAFSPESALSERDQRPHLTAAYYVENVYRELADEPTHLDELLQFTMVVQEYYDILDDVVDADLEPEAASEATVDTQALFPVAVQLLDELPEGSERYWSVRAVRLVESWSMELRNDPDPDTFLEVLDRQSHLYGFVTGLAAAVAGTDEEAVRHAEELGRAVYKLDATWLDLVQHELETDPEWNAYELYDPETVTDFLLEWSSEAAEHVDAIAEDREFQLRTPLAEAFEEWYEKYPAEDPSGDAILPT